ncbi:variant sh3 domain containing protein [Acanthamoeba castellanii str. Neff]|uniref:Variant sh3 domain containing protein n=1 Tax=Acanthamoeba castellanii (strain ATCC 30010 / Neff) TaxID=1257118 RepID=L8H3X2_ACACF|nr:variant sh3 domain containing protein [Acanthamoeba castellanii str. Neff]ELR19932.1 variant sh3 domain containing protein [Acanthamoeba castellanii str. Neff]
MQSGLAASRLPSPPPSPVKPVPPRPHRATTAPHLRAPPPAPALRCQPQPPHRPLRAYDSELLVTTTKERRRQQLEWSEEKNESEGDKNEDEAEEEARLQDQFWGVIPVPLPLVPATAPVAYVPRLIVVETEPAGPAHNFQTLASPIPTATSETKMSSAPPSIRVEQDDDEEGNNAGEEVAPAVPVPPRPVLPKRHSAEPSRAKIGACTSVQPGAEPVVAVPPRPLLPKKRSTTLNSSPQLPRPTPDQEELVPVPARPRLPTRGMARSDGELMRPISPRPDEADQPKEEAGRGDEDDEAERRQSDEERPARQREEELKRRQLEQERLAPFAPKLLYSDSFYADREKQKEDSLEELRVWREEERRQAIEREREKAAKVVSIDELNVRPEGGQRQIRRSVKDDHHHRAKVVSEGRETLRREGVLLVRAIDEFKGKMLLTPDAVSSKKRKQLKFKLNDIIRVTAVNVEEGLYFGTLEKGGKAGWFPSFYVVNVVK